MKTIAQIAKEFAKEEKVGNRWKRNAKRFKRMRELSGARLKLRSLFPNGSRVSVTSIVSLFFVFFLFSGLTPRLSLSSKETVKELKTAMAFRSELRGDSITVVDLGTGNAEFLGYIKTKLSLMGYGSVDVIGVDNYSFMNNSDKRYFNIMKKKMESVGCRLVFSDARDLDETFPKADIVFANAPDLQSIEVFADASKIILKEHGIFFIRFHVMQDSLLLKKWVIKNGWILYAHNFSNELGEGAYPLERTTYILRRKPFENSNLVRTFFDALVEMEKLKKSA